MNCKEVAKYLYAFADGELDTGQNLQVLEHIKMCASCCAKVDAQEQLKKGLIRTLGGQEAPASLRNRVEAMIAGEAGTAMHGMPTEEPSRTRSVFRRYWMSGALAAAIVLVWISIWNVQGNHSNMLLDNIRVTDGGASAVALADRIYALHQAASDKGPALHDPALPLDPHLAAQAMKQQLAFPILRCSDGTTIPNSTFESASYCQLVDAWGIQHRGGQLIYRRTGSNETVSLISVQKMPQKEMEAIESVHHQGRELRILKPTVATSLHPMTIIAFDCPAATHIVCAPVEPSEAVEMVLPLEFKYAGGSVGKLALTHSLR